VHPLCFVDFSHILKRYLPTTGSAMRHVADRHFDILDGAFLP
jgi:hypothetical protein